jgi:hypothetical protein
MILKLPFDDLQEKKWSITFMQHRLNECAELIYNQVFRSQLHSEEEIDQFLVKIKKDLRIINRHEENEKLHLDSVK